MADDLNTEIKISANAEGVETGVARAKRSIASLGQEAARAGDQGARGLDRMKEGGDGLALSMDRTTKNFVASLQRQIAALESGGVATRQYQESIAQLRGANLAQLKPYLDQLDAAKAKAEAAAKAQGSLTDRLGAMGPVASAATAQLAALGSSFTLAGIAMFIKRVNDGIDALNDIKDATGSTIENISALEDVGKRTGASLDLVGGVLIKFNDLLSKATPKSDIALQLKAIGLEAEELKKLDPAEALRRTAVALSGYADDANKARLIQDLFGKSVKEAAPFLADLAEKQELAGNVTSKQADEADRLNKELFKLQTHASDAARALATKLVPVLNRIFDDFSTFGSKLSLAGLAVELRAADAEVRRLQSRKGGLFNFAADIDAELAKAQARLKAAKEAFNAADVGRPSAAGAPGGDAPKPSVVPPPTAAELAAAKAAAEKAARDATDARIAVIRRGLANEVALTKGALDEIGSLRRMQMISERELIDRNADAEVAQMQRQRAALVAEMEVRKASGGSLKELADLRGQIDVVDTEIAQRREQQQRQLNELTYRQKQAILEVNAARRQEDQAAIAAAESERLDVWNRLIDDVNEYKRQLDLGVEATEFELGLLWEGERSRKIAIEQYQVQVRLKEKLRSIDMSTATAAQKDIAKGVAAEAAAREMANVTQKVAIEESRKTAEQIDGVFRQGFADMLNNGKDAWSSFTKSLATTFKTAVADQIYKTFAQPIVLQLAAGVTGFLGLGGGGVGGAVNGVSGGLNALSTANNAYTALSGYSGGVNTLAGLLGGGQTAGSSAAALGYANAVGAAGGDALGAFFAGNASWGGVGAGSLASMGSLMGGGSAVTTSLPGFYVGNMGYGVGAASNLGLLGSGTYGMTGVGTGLATGVGTGVGTGVSTGVATGAAVETGVAAGAAAEGGMMSALASNPYGWIALAAIAAIALFSGKGETRMGGQYGVNFEGDDVLNARRGTTVTGTKGEVTFLEGPSGGDPARDYAVKLIEGTTEGINKLFEGLGSEAAITSFQAGMETSSKGKGGVFSGGKLNTGALFGESGEGDGTTSPFESTSKRGGSAEEVAKAFATDMLQVTVQALQAATDLPKVVADQLNGINAEELTDEAATTLLNSISAQIEFVKGFRDAINQLPFENLRDLSFDAAAGLIAAGGGLETFAQNQSGFFQNYFSAEEQREAAIKRLSLAFEELDLTMPALSDEAGVSREAFRVLATGIDVTTEAGQKQYAGLIALQGAFAELTPAIEDAATAARTAADIASERSGLERQLMQALGDTAGLRALELGALDESNRALQLRLYALADEKAAQDAALAALRRSTSAQITALQATASAASEAVANTSALIDTLAGGISQLRGEAAKTDNAAAAREFIARAESAARQTGYLPDAEQLSEAISAALAGFDPNRYSSVAQMEFEQMALAGQLEALQGVAGAQKSVAQQQLDAANSQIDYLNRLTQSASDQLDALRGVDNSVKSVAQAIAEFAAATGRTPTAGSSGNSSSTSGGGFVIGGGGSPGASPTGSSSAPYDPGNGWKREFVGADGTSSWIPVWDITEAGRLAQVQGVLDSAKGEDGLASLFSSVKAAGGTLSDLQVLTGHSLDDLRKAAASFGIPAFAVGTNYVPRDMIAQIHEGEAIVPKAFNPWAGGSGGSNAELVAEVRALREEVGELRKAAQDTADNTSVLPEMATQFDSVSEGGNAFRVEVMKPIPVPA